MVVLLQAGLQPDFARMTAGCILTLYSVALIIDPTRPRMGPGCRPWLRRALASPRGLTVAHAHPTRFYFSSLTEAPDVGGGDVSAPPLLTCRSPSCSPSRHLSTYRISAGPHQSHRPCGSFSASTGATWKHPLGRGGVGGRSKEVGYFGWSGGSVANWCFRHGKAIIGCWGAVCDCGVQPRLTTPPSHFAFAVATAKRLSQSRHMYGSMHGLPYWQLEVGPLTERGGVRGLWDNILD